MPSLLLVGLVDADRICPQRLYEDWISDIQQRIAKGREEPLKFSHCKLDSLFHPGFPMHMKAHHMEARPSVRQSATCSGVDRALDQAEAQECESMSPF